MVTGYPIQIGLRALPGESAGVPGISTRDSFVPHSFEWFTFFTTAFQKANESIYARKEECQGGTRTIF